MSLCVGVKRAGLDDTLRALCPGNVGLSLHLASSGHGMSGGESQREGRGEGSSFPHRVGLPISGFSDLTSSLLMPEWSRSCRLFCTTVFADICRCLRRMQLCSGDVAGQTIYTFQFVIGTPQIALPTVSLFFKLL